MKTVTITVKILRVEVTSVFLDGPVKGLSGEELHHLCEDIFVFVHNFELKTAAKLITRPPQIVKCQRTV
jgi:hypothetical protein